MNTTYELTVTKISEGKISEQGGLTAQYECVITVFRPAGICGPVASCDEVVNYTEWAYDAGFLIDGFPEIGTRYDGAAIATFPVVAR